MQLKNLAKQTAIYGIPSIVGRFLNFLLVPLYTYSFIPAEYGVVTEFYAYMAFFMVLLTYGMETAFFRFIQKYKSYTAVYSTSLWSLLCTSSIFFLAVFLNKESLANWMGTSGASSYILCFALILVADVLSVLPFCLLREENKAFRFAILKMINIATNIGLNLFFILYCPHVLHANPDSWIRLVYDPNIGVGYIFISNLAASLLTLLLLFPEWKKFHFNFNYKLWKEIMIYALPVMVWGMAGIVNETFDRILLRYLIPDTQDALYQLGVYGACYKISIVMTLFIQAFRFAAEPFFFKQAEEKNAPQVYAQVMKFFVITCAFIFLICVLFLDYLMYFVGADFRVGVGVVPVLLLANLFLGVFYNLSVWYKITDRTRVGAYISTIGAALTLLLNFVWIPIWGYHGAAWATLTCYFCIAVISYFWGQKYYPIPYPLKRISFYIGFVIALYMLKVFFVPALMLWQLIYALVALAIFCTTLLYLERDSFKNIRIKINKK
ncbi:MAG: oligosaccharide flippase family protein [Bacteroidales bacterium]